MRALKLTGYLSSCFPFINKEEPEARKRDDFRLIVDGGMQGRMDAGMQGRMDGRMQGRMVGWMEGCRGGWRDGGMQGRMDGRIGGWMSEQATSTGLAPPPLPSSLSADLRQAP